MDKWIVVAKKRINRVLAKRRISYSSHFEVKISEAGPGYMRAEPHVIHNTLKAMVKDGELAIYTPESPVSGQPKFYIPKDFKDAGDHSRARHFLEWRELFVKVSQESKYCGFVLEKMIFDAVLETDKYHVFGGAPTYDENEFLTKKKSSELLDYQGNRIYKAESGSGFDLFVVNKAANVPIGIEAKNLRDWIYPASVEVWRAIARACTLNCLPVIIARKISFIARVGFFAEFGILGFQTNFQYMAHRVQADTNYKFKNRVIHKDYLGFADIKLVKPKDNPPPHLYDFFNETLDTYAEEYYQKFLKHKDLLKKYAIDYEMAEPSLNQGKRFYLYQKFKEEAGFRDVELDLEVDD